ncbi:inositol monophosphatase [Epibacterium ulvae]|uniref:inositol monophosphatase family protein n=1 Tax=Epibacterium ulvae TaxID=1156985 RepID=UPI001BFC317B|nr:inositol monophosphatase [Epibacterium ulvae]MBT8155643.1 inositol monophosphatase [Epibacterium ulvae]
MTDRTEFIRDLAEEAAALGLKLRREQGADFVQTKGHQDFVTFADRAVEELIRARIAEQFPGEDVLGEEEGQTGDGPKLWVVDPIDGTANYMRGGADWAVSIAYVEDGVLSHAAICAPELDVTLWAANGQGAQVRYDGAVNAVKLSDCTDPKAAMLMLGWSGRQPVPSHVETILNALAAGMEYRRNGSAVISLLAVAMGRAEGYWERYVNAWDVFAMWLILEEAGAVIETLPPLDFIGSPKHFLAMVPALEADLRAVVGTLPPVD